MDLYGQGASRVQTRLQAPDAVSGNQRRRRIVGRRKKPSVSAKKMLLDHRGAGSRGNAAESFGLRQHWIGKLYKI